MTTSAPPDLQLPRPGEPAPWFHAAAVVNPRFAFSSVAGRYALLAFVGPAGGQPAGGGVVFSCSLLHEATPVTRGTRYAVLPFLYDKAAALTRGANLTSLGLPPLAAAAAQG